MALNLNREGVALDGDARNKRNENWGMIENEVQDYQAQIDQLVVDGDSSPEAAQARVAVDGTSYMTLKARLDAEEVATNQQLADTTNEMNKIPSRTALGRIKVDNITNRVSTGGQLSVLNSSIPYGEIELPSDFPKLPFTLFRDRDGLMKHNYDLTQFNTGDVTIYIDSTKNDNNDGLTAATAVYSLKKALEIAVARVEVNIVIKFITDHVVLRSSLPVAGFTITNKRITIMPNDAGKTYYIGTAEVATWTLESGNTYKTSRTNCTGIADFTPQNKDVYGVAKPYKKVNSIAEVGTTKGSWYTDGATVYVHTLTSTQPAGPNIYLTLSVACLELKLSNSTLIIKDATIYNGGRGKGLYVYGEKTSSFIGINTKVSHCNYFNDTLGEDGNGFATSDLGQTLLFNCTSAYINRDGFNYHYSSIAAADRRSCLAVEYNCVAYKCGINSGEYNNNATTCHEGASILRVGSIGYKTKGPVCSDVNACHSIFYDCHMRDSLLHFTASANTSSDAAYYMNTTSAPTEVGNGKLIMVNSGGGGEVGYALSVGGAIPMTTTLQKFIGVGFKDVVDPIIIP